MQIVPYWIQWLQALATPVIAALAIVIGVMQWRTAHQRAVLDLFDKRWTVLTEFRAAVIKIVGERKLTPETTFLYATAQDRAAFLFGPEVKDYLESIRKLTQRLVVDPQGTGDAVIEIGALLEIAMFFKRGDDHDALHADASAGAV